MCISDNVLRNQLIVFEQLTHSSLVPFCGGSFIESLIFRVLKAGPVFPLIYQESLMSCLSVTLGIEEPSERCSMSFGKIGRELCFVADYESPLSYYSSIEPCRAERGFKLKTAF